ncbi:MAG: hypothetical protein KAI66_04010 [Lentisphaeria bacterium]|nr:hypothetical protein [Lentisphaeria bacterium]
MPLPRIFGKSKESQDDLELDETGLDKSILQQEQQENLEQDISILEDEDGKREQHLQKVAEKEVQSAAEDSVKKLHVIKMGRCPVCNDHLHQHLFASICESCGWHKFDMPKTGPVRIHMRNGNTIEGERCYVVKTGSCLLLKDDLVVAKIPRDAYNQVEYVWSENEIDQRHKQVAERMNLACGWCGGPAEMDADGFHMTHIAFGASQERYCFCSDECYEAFRKMYPARVHRDCYERNCGDCTLCVKRYGDEAEGVRMLAKDYLSVGRKKKKS